MFALIALTSCTTHTVKLGKKCTKVSLNSTYEKSFIWVVKKETVPTFEQKINEKNCLEIEEKT